MDILLIEEANFMREIPYYNDFISSEIFDYLKKEGKPVLGIPHLFEVGNGGGLETTESLTFLCQLYDLVKTELNSVLSKRQVDRLFIDQQTKGCYEFNNFLGSILVHLV